MSKTQGVEELLRNFAKLEKKFGEGVAISIVEAANIVRSDAVKSIQKKSNGQEVTRYRAGGKPYQHTASAPGDAPNTDTGRLVGSIAVEVAPNDVFVGTSLEYGKHLEFGTSSTEARPWLNPALDRNRKKIKSMIAAAMKKVCDDA